MIKCKNKCPSNKFDGCCIDCPESTDCNDLCELMPDSCSDSIYGGTDLTVFNEKAAAIIETISDIVTQKKKLEEIEKDMREKLKSAMETYNIKSVDNDAVKITYVDASSRTSIDSAKLKKNYPVIAAECAKVSTVEAFVKIKVK